MELNSKTTSVQFSEAVAGLKYNYNCLYNESTIKSLCCNIVLETNPNKNFHVNWNNGDTTVSGQVEGFDVGAIIVACTGVFDSAASDIETYLSGLVV